MRHLHNGSIRYNYGPITELVFVDFYVRFKPYFLILNLLRQPSKPSLVFSITFCWVCWFWTIPSHVILFKNFCLYTCYAFDGVCQSLHAFGKGEFVFYGLGAVHV